VAAAAKSEGFVQELGRQVSATAAIAEKPVPHWQPMSLAAHPAAARPDWRQPIAQAGSAPNCADTIVAAAARVKSEAFIFPDYRYF